MEITAVAVQKVPIHGNVIFTDTPISGSCCIVHRQGSGIVKIRGLSNTQSRARFRASFSSNISIPTDEGTQPISLALALEGEPIQSSIMIVTPANPQDYFNVAADVFVEVPVGCDSNLSVVNTSTIPINVRNANFIVERVA